MTQLDMFVRPQNVHQNSIATLSEERHRLGQRANEILAYFSRADVSKTDRAVMIGLGYTDMNAVRPRITELTGKGLLMETGGIRDTETGKPVRVSAITRKGREYLETL
jgi:glutamate dehydrogenase/leucine dehydrogenase